MNSDIVHSSVGRDRSIVSRNGNRSRFGSKASMARGQVSEIGCWPFLCIVPACDQGEPPFPLYMTSTVRSGARRKTSKWSGFDLTATALVPWVILICALRRSMACGIAAARDLAQDLVGLAPDLLHRYPAVTADDDALVGRPAAAVAGAVVDEESLDAGGLDADAEADELVVPCGPGPVGGPEGLDGSLGQAQLDPRDTFSGICHGRGGFLRLSGDVVGGGSGVSVLCLTVNGLP